MPRESVAHARNRPISWSQWFLMRTSDYEASLPKPTSEELDQQNARDMANDLVNGIMSGMNKQKLDPTAGLLWDAGAKLMESGGINSRFERLGILMMLDALMASPEAVQKAIRVLHDEYAKAHPQLPT